MGRRRPGEGDLAPGPSTGAISKGLVGPGMAVPVPGLWELDGAVVEVAGGAISHLWPCARRVNAQISAQQCWALRTAKQATEQLRPAHLKRKQFNTPNGLERSGLPMRGRAL